MEKPMKNILLITGWGIGVELLYPLQNALQQQDYQADLIQIFDAQDPEQFQQHVQLAEHYDVLIGWSLGGQLAALLAHAVYMQFGKVISLISLASHPCFVSDDPNLYAMSQQRFAEFAESYQDHPQGCIKNFLYLLSKGSTASQHKKNWLKLQNIVQPQDRGLMLRGLSLLNELNVVDILKNYPGPQLHIFAHQDVLVNVQVSSIDAFLSAKFPKFDLIEAEHAFPYFQVELCLDKILTKINETSLTA